MSEQYISGIRIEAVICEEVVNIKFITLKAAMRCFDALAGDASIETVTLYVREQTHSECKRNLAVDILAYAG